MRRLFVLYCMIFALLLAACASVETNEIPEPSISPEDLIGKTLDELEGTLVIDRDMRAYGYGFATDEVGNPMVYTYDRNEEKKFVVTHAEIFAAKDTDNSPEMFEIIQPGMTIYEVVKILGNPVEITGSGVFYLVFKDSDGKRHFIAWRGDPLFVSFIPGREALD